MAAGPVLAAVRSACQRPLVAALRPVQARRGAAVDGGGPRVHALAARAPPVTGPVGAGGPNEVVL